MQQSIPNALSCACDRALDVGCGCVERRVLVDYRPSWDSKALGLLVVDDVDGRRDVYFRRVDFPVARGPFEVTP